MSERLGVVLWRGQSRIDRSPIVVIATGLKRPTKNIKTGNMIQTWILCEDVDPVTAVKSGLDYGICGDCPLGGDFGERTCYVKVWQAPAQVYLSYVAGNYPDYDPDEHERLFFGRQVRLGSYGDPAAVPVSILFRTIRLATGAVGYTHQWRTCRKEYGFLLMASCESEEDVRVARSMGWRTFRAKRPNEPRMPQEIVCPSSAEEGHRLQCSSCLACHGAGNGHDVVIDLHGPISRRIHLLQVNNE